MHEKGVPFSALRVSPVSSRLCAQFDTANAHPVPASDHDIDAPKIRIVFLYAAAMLCQRTGTAPDGSICDKCVRDYGTHGRLLRHLREVHRVAIPPQRSGPRRKDSSQHASTKTFPGKDGEQCIHEANVGSSHFDELQQSCGPWETATWYKETAWDADYFWECKKLLPKILELPRLESMSEDSKCQDFAFPKVVRSMDVVGEYSMGDVCDYVTRRELQRLVHSQY